MRELVTSQKIGRRLRSPGTRTVTNVSGLPAMSLPLHWSADGLPCGVQFIASHANEALLFRLAARLEEAQPWFDKLPPIHA